MTVRTTAMRMPMCVLMVEDCVEDAELVLRELRRGGYEPEYRTVAAAEELVAALDSREWDLILCDYTMVGFSGAQALALVRSRGLDVPFIFVSGTIGEETAVAAMRAGAQDYVIKDNLKRLVPAIERELREAAVRRDHARAEAERRAAERRFREVLAMAPDAILAADEDQRVIVFNRAAEALFGYSAEEISGQSLDLLLPSRFAASHRRHLAKFVQAPVAIRRMNERGETFGRRKNGKEFPAEASLSKLVENGKTTFLAVIRDISDRRRDEATLRKLSRAVDHSASLIVITDRAGVIEYANRSLLNKMGYTEGEVIGRKPSLWKSGKTSEADYAELWETVLAGGDWQGEFENRCRDGRPIAVFATISPIKDQRGRITHFISIQEDITQRKALEEQLRQAQKMEVVGQLTGGLAHDFNNLLTVIIGNLDLMQAEFEANAKAGEMARLALEASLRGAELTRQLLAFSRRQPLQITVFDLNELVSGTTDLLRRTLGEQIKIEIDLAADLWPALADPTQLESALTNLAINARDAMPVGGRLTIETANKNLDDHYAAANVEVTPGDYVMIAVSDTGSGIPPEILEKVFEPFFTTKEKGRGTGLGLSMVYGFAKQSGGHVKIYSEVGHGTTVRFYLPRGGLITKSSNADLPEEAEVEPPDATVLVVEDDAAVRSVAVNQLKALGYRVVEAEDGKTALELLGQDRSVDLLFTDMVMPGGMSGADLAREARKRRPALKALFTSGYAEAALGNGACIGEGGNLLSKPYRKVDLERKIREVLRRGGGHRGKV